MSAYSEDIQEKNRKYREDLSSLRARLSSDLRTLGNVRAAEALEADDDLGLSTVFYIMFTSCGLVDFSKKEPAIIKNCKATYDIWDREHLCLASAEDILSAVAIGAVDDPRSPVLCAPGVLSDDDRALFEGAFDVVYSEQAHPVFGYGTLGRHPVVNVPDWAYHEMASNALDRMAHDLLESRSALCVSDLPHSMFEDEFPTLPHAVLFAMCSGAPLPDKMVYRPASGKNVEEWKKRAVRKFVISPDVDEDMRRVYDICRLWVETCSRLSVASVTSMRELSNEPELVVKNIGKLGELIGMESMVEAYLSGVPVEDILA